MGIFLRLLIVLTVGFSVGLSFLAHSTSQSQIQDGVNTDLHDAILEHYPEAFNKMIILDGDGAYRDRLFRSRQEKQVLRKVQRIVRTGGIDLDARGQHGKTALQLTIEQHYPRVFKLLLENGANVHIPMNWGGNYLVHQVILEETMLFYVSSSLFRYDKVDLYRESDFFKKWLLPLWLYGADFSVSNDNGEFSVELLIQPGKFPYITEWVVRAVGTKYLPDWKRDQLSSHAERKNGYERVVRLLRNPTGKRKETFSDRCWFSILPFPNPWNSSKWHGSLSL